MQLENTFTVPTGIEEAWAAFNDPQRFVPCFPGATLESCDADGFTGTVKVKLGPISLRYQGKGAYLERDEDNHRVLVEASGRDAHGNGTAGAKVTGSLEAEGPDRTKVVMVTDLTVTGRPAQFGRGVMADVSDKIISQFASCLAKKLGPREPAAEEPPAAEPAAAEPAVSEPPAGEAAAAAGPAPVRTIAASATTLSSNGSGPAPLTASVPAQSESGGEADAIDLIGAAGPPVLKRALPVFVAFLLLFILLRRLKHRGRG